MALIRCPECGRVADPPECFACGHVWAEEPEAPAVPAAPPEEQTLQDHPVPPISEDAPPLASALEDVGFDFELGDVEPPAPEADDGEAPNGMALLEQMDAELAAEANPFAQAQPSASPGWPPAEPVATPAAPTGADANPWAAEPASGPASPWTGGVSAPGEVEHGLEMAPAAPAPATSVEQAQVSAPVEADVPAPLAHDEAPSAAPVAPAPVVDEVPAATPGADVEPDVPARAPEGFAFDVPVPSSETEDTGEFEDRVLTGESESLSTRADKAPVSSAPPAIDFSGEADEPSVPEGLSFDDIPAAPAPAPAVLDDAPLDEAAPAAAPSDVDVDAADPAATDAPEIPLEDTTALSGLARELEAAGDMASHDDPLGDALFAGGFDVEEEPVGAAPIALDTPDGVDEPDIDAELAEFDFGFDADAPEPLEAPAPLEVPADADVGESLDALSLDTDFDEFEFDLADEEDLPAFEPEPDTSASDALPPAKTGVYVDPGLNLKDRLGILASDLELDGQLDAAGLVREALAALD